MSAADLLALADRVEREPPSRELSDAVLLACGWQLNFSAAEIEEVRNGGRLLQDDAGDDYLQPYGEFMDCACWYAPGSKPFRDKWIHGYYRPHPTASLEAAASLVPKGWGAVLALNADGSGAAHLVENSVSAPRMEFAKHVEVPAAALTAAAALRAIATKETT